MAPPPISDPEQIRSIILNEVNGAIAQDLILLKSLYAPGAVVVDHNGTPDDPSDDTTWNSWANIERRYLAFFSAGFSSLTLVDLSIYYGYEGSGPQPGATNSVTFFTVVEKGDYVEKITFSFNGQTLQLCLDGKGGWSRC